LQSEKLAFLQQYYQPKSAKGTPPSRERASVRCFFSLLSMKSPWNKHFVKRGSFSSCGKLCGKDPENRCQRGADCGKTFFKR
jgi:hypothetical protein